MKIAPILILFKGRNHSLDLNYNLNDNLHEFKEGSSYRWTKIDSNFVNLL